MTSILSSEDTRQTGVYRIVNRINGKRYVGSVSTHFGRRWSTHKCLLNGGRHHSTSLQADWIAYGEAAFAFEIVERTLPEHACAMEQSFLDYWKPFEPDGYNTRLSSGTVDGRKRSSSAKKKIGDFHRGKIISEKHREIVGNTHRGKPKSEQQRQNMSLAQRGRVISDEARQKMSIAKKGKPKDPKFILQVMITKLEKYIPKWDALSTKDQKVYLRKHGGKNPHQVLEQLKMEAGQ